MTINAKKVLRTAITWMNLKGIHTKWVKKKQKQILHAAWFHLYEILKRVKKVNICQTPVDGGKDEDISQKVQYETFGGIEVTSILIVVVVMIPLYAFVKTHQIVHKNW